MIPINKFLGQVLTQNGSCSFFALEWHTVLIKNYPLSAIEMPKF